MKMNKKVLIISSSPLRAEIQIHSVTSLEKVQRKQAIPWIKFGLQR